MKQVQINLGSRSYQIYIGRGLLAQAGALVAGLPVGRRVMLVTNPTVGGIYARRVMDSLTKAGMDVVLAEVPDGEEYKALPSAQLLYDRAFAAGLDRGCAIIALGGGVIGDLAGFVAATYMRGVPFIQMPTTLLAQVDSSVGGKVAVNHPRGKNIIGAFYQPALVLTDTDTLQTLEAREIRSGLAEVIKYGIIKDAAFFAWLEKNMRALLALEPEPLAHAVEVSCRIKAAVVEEDETELGSRAILNFGHTVGHAIEAITNYRQYRHGEAVAMGMAVASGLAEKLTLAGPGETSRIEALLKDAGLPVRLPGTLDVQEMLDAMSRDKKVYNGQIAFVLPRAIGEVSIERNIPEDKVIESMRENMALSPMSALDGLNF